MKAKQYDMQITMLTPLLATTPGDPKLFGKWVAANAPDPAKAAEELGIIQAQSAGEEQERGSTVFMRIGGQPHIAGYLIKGNIKANTLALIETGGCPLTPWSYKRYVNLYVHVKERFLPLDCPGPITSNQRPLRTDINGIEHVCLARSEEAPAGTKLKFTLTVMPARVKVPRSSELSPRGFHEYVLEALEYGKYNGLGCWRSSGLGQFEYEILDERDVDVFPQ